MPNGTYGGVRGQKMKVGRKLSFSSYSILHRLHRTKTMINYSIVMRSVNANLFEINQAKSRIKAAEAAGQTPSADDQVHAEHLFG